MKAENTPAVPLAPAVLYARVSSQEQHTGGYSIPAQMQLLERYATVNGFRIIKQFVDVESAKETGRTHFTEMLTFVRKFKGGSLAILAEKTDRLHRGLHDHVKMDDLLRTCDVALHLVKEHKIISSTSSSAEKLGYNMMAVLAQNYIDNLSEEAKKGMRQKAETGMWPSMAPVGYRNVRGPNGKSIIEPDPHYGPMVTRIFEWYATANFSMAQIGELAAEHGWFAPKTKKPYSAGSVAELLDVRTYTGMFEWGGKLFQGTYTPLVSVDLWQRAQEARQKRNRKGKKSLRRKHLFAYSGLIQDGGTGRQFVADRKKGKYVYYAPGGKHKGPGTKPRVREADLDLKFAEALQQLDFGEDILAVVTEALKQSQAEKKKLHTESLARLKAEYTKLDTRADRAYEDYLEGKITEERCLRLQEKWREEQGRLLADIERHQVASEEFIQDGIHLLELARKAHSLFLQQPAEEKRKMLQLVCSNCIFDEGELKIELEQPFEALRVTNAAWNEKKVVGANPDDLHEVWYAREDSNL